METRRASGPDRQAPASLTGVERVMLLLTIVGVLAALVSAVADLLALVL